MHAIIAEVIKKRLSTRVIYALFSIGCLVCLYQVWSPAHFLTTDGPCHLYNAGVLRDLFLKRHDGFYESLYRVNTQINANWFSHLILAMLLSVFKAAVAEKILISGYLLLFLFGMAKLVRCLNKQQAALILVPFLFVFNVPLMKGFYNFSYSIALFPLFLWIFLLLFEQVNSKKTAMALLISFLCFFAHPVGYILSVACAFFLLFTTQLSISRSLKPLLKKMRLLSMIQLPFLLMTFYFSQTNQSTPFRLYFNRDFLTRYFLKFSSFQCACSNEEIICYCAAAALLLVFLFSVIQRIRAKVLFLPCDGIAYAVIFVFGLYLFLPDYYWCQLLELRLQVFLYLTVFLFIVCHLRNEWVSQGLSLVLFGCFLLLSAIRMPILQKTSNLRDEIIQAEQQIPSKTVLLGLNFSHHGKDGSGNLINEKVAVFSHAHQQYDTRRAIFFLDNYEANMSWFPLRYHDQVNPYKYLCTNESLESEEPEIDVLHYEQISKHRIDFVLTYFLPPLELRNEHVAETMRQIETLYMPVYQSASEQIVLYKRKP